jgi:cell division ATPase FtsA
MNIPFFTKKHKEHSLYERNTIALDVGTEYVKAAIFRVEDGQVHIKGYAKAKQQSDAMKGAMIVDLQNVIENCDMAIGEALYGIEKEELPTHVVMGIAGELVYGITIMAEYERPNPEKKIDQKEIDDAIASVRKNSFPEAKVQIS